MTGITESTLNELQRRIESAKNKPGSWHESRSSQAVIVSVPDHEQQRRESAKPQAGLKRLWHDIALAEPPGNIAEMVELADARLAIAAVNALPDLLALAKDGLKYQALRFTKDNQ